MRYRPLSKPYHVTKRDFGFRDMPITVLLLQRQTLLSLIEMNMFSVECMRVASNRAEHGQFDTTQVYDWEHAETAFNQFFDSKLCLENLIHLTKRYWVADLFGGRQKLIVHTHSFDNLMFEYDRKGCLLW
jgi:hypothetical protein